MFSSYDHKKVKEISREIATINAQVLAYIVKDVNKCGWQSYIVFPEINIKKGKCA